MPGEVPDMTAIDTVTFKFALQHVGHLIGTDPRDQPGFAPEARHGDGCGCGGAAALREKTGGAVLFRALRQLRGAKDVVLHRMTDAEDDLHEEVTS